MRLRTGYGWPATATTVTGPSRPESGGLLGSEEKPVPFPPGMLGAKPSFFHCANSAGGGRGGGAASTLR